MALQREEQEQLRINIPDEKILAPRTDNPKFLTFAIIVSLTTVGMISFCLVFHHLVKGTCYSQATLDANGWTWNAEYCVIKKSNNTVEIRSAGVYIIDIQVFSKSKNGLTDLVLKTSPTKNEIIAGAFENPSTKEAFSKLNQILKLRVGDEVSLTVNGIKNTFNFNDSRTTYWKIVKLPR